MENAPQGMNASQALRMYGVLWLSSFFFAVGASVACSAFTVPYFQVVNVQLAITFAFALISATLHAILLVLLILGGQFRTALTNLFVAILFALLALAPVAAFQLWGALFGIDIAEQSFMMKGFADTLTWAASGATGAFSGFGDAGAAAATTQWTPMALYLSLISALLALFSVAQGMWAARDSAWEGEDPRTPF
jgi:hypothetical protein